MDHIMLGGMVNLPHIWLAPHECHTWAQVLLYAGWVWAAAVIVEFGVPLIITVGLVSHVVAGRIERREELAAEGSQ